MIKIIKLTTGEELIGDVSEVDKSYTSGLVMPS